MTDQFDEKISALAQKEMGSHDEFLIRSNVDAAARVAARDAFKRGAQAARELLRGDINVELEKSLKFWKAEAEIQVTRMKQYNQTADKEITRLEKELAEALKQPMAFRPPENDKEIFDFLKSKLDATTKENEALRDDLEAKNIANMAMDNFADVRHKACVDLNNRLTAQNAMMREALEFYSDLDKYEPVINLSHPRQIEVSCVDMDGGKRARECLAAIDKEMK